MLDYLIISDSKSHRSIVVIKSKEDKYSRRFHTLVLTSNTPITVVPKAKSKKALAEWMAEDDTD